MSKKSWEDIYHVVRQIPRGRVMNYGAVADVIARPMSARAVGWAMHQCPEDVPWHRVVNASGGISTEPLHPMTPGLQRKLLEAEGVVFGPAGRCHLETYLFSPSRQKNRKK